MKDRTRKLQKEFILLQKLFNSIGREIETAQRVDENLLRKIVYI